MARPSKQQNIELWLKGLLSAGRRKAEDVLAAAVASGYATERSARTLHTVKASLGIVSEKENNVWYWRDPAIAQPKAASDDKLDILIHEVKEATRLAMPVVPVSNPVAAPFESDSFVKKKSKPYDPNDPVNKAIADQHARTEARFKAVQGVVTSADPFALLESTNLDEVDQMLDVVRNHHAGYGDQKLNEDDAIEMGKWETWIDRARERRKKLVAEGKLAAEAA